MMLFLDKRFVFRKGCNQSRGKIGDTIKEVYANRKIRAKYECSIPMPNDLLYFRLLLVPAGCTLNQRYLGGHARPDIPPNRRRRCEIDSHVSAFQLFSQLYGRQTGITVVNNNRDPVSFFLTEPVDEFSHRSVSDQSNFQVILLSDHVYNTATNPQDKLEPEPAI